MESKTELLRRVRRMAREKFAWPGGYALALVMDDGGILCPDCVRVEYRQISYATRHGLRGGWGAEGIEHSGIWDNPGLCDHCGRVIE